MKTSARKMMRKAKNAMMDYSDIEVLVREATSNDPWGPSSSLMHKISQSSSSPLSYHSMLVMLWKRLTDYPYMRHVYKSLVLIEYLLKNGSERFISDVRLRAGDIRRLKAYKFYKEGAEVAQDVRKKAAQILALLDDKESLEQERELARRATGKVFGGYSPDGSSKKFRNESDFADSRRRSAEEAESRDDMDAASISPVEVKRVSQKKVQRKKKLAPSSKSDLGFQEANEKNMNPTKNAVEDIDLLSFAVGMTGATDSAHESKYDADLFAFSPAAGTGASVQGHKKVDRSSAPTYGNARAADLKFANKSEGTKTELAPGMRLLADCDLVTDRAALLKSSAPEWMREPVEPKRMVVDETLFDFMKPAESKTEPAIAAKASMDDGELHRDLIENDLMDIMNLDMTLSERKRQEKKAEKDSMLKTGRKLKEIEAGQSLVTFGAHGLYPNSMNMYSDPYSGADNSALVPMGSGYAYPQLYWQ